MLLHLPVWRSAGRVFQLFRYAHLLLMQQMHSQMSRCFYGIVNPDGFFARRNQLFIIKRYHNHFLEKHIKICRCAFLPLCLFTFLLPEIIKRPALLNPLAVTFSSWAKYCFYDFLIAGFILLLQKSIYNNILSELVPFGKMGLTNYILQSIAGSTLYYKYGFDLYKYTNPFYGLFIVITLFLINHNFCKWWLKTYKQGTLEYV